jgi:hypothetical protein
VKYILLIFSNPGNPHFSGDELDPVGAEVGALMGELAESGEWIGGEALADPAQAKTVNVRDGSPAITDGPFTEAKEHLAGYCLLDCETVSARPQDTGGPRRLRTRNQQRSCRSPPDVPIAEG